MPRNPSITTAYAGENIKDILQLLILENEVMAKQIVHVYEDVQKSMKLTRGNVAAYPLRKYQSMPTNPINALSFDERSLNPVLMQLFDLINPMEFQNYWREYQPKGPLVDKVTDPAILKVIVELYRKRVGQHLAKLFWSADTSLADSTNLNFFDGIITKAVADANVPKFTPAGNLTSANINSVMDGMDAMILSQLYRDPSYIWHMSTNSARLFRDADIAQTNKGKSRADDDRSIDDIKYKNRAINNYSEFPDNYILLAKAGTNPLDTHLFMGVNMVDDAENLKVERYRPEGSQWFIEANMQMDVNYSFSEELVLYKPS